MPLPTPEACCSSSTEIYSSPWMVTRSRVRVTQQNGRLVIELHIAVSYGLNISTAARSISHRVKDEVEQATGLKVARVVVSVDDVIA